jgi:hypothetical protein
MKHRRVVTTPEADADPQRIDEWWIQHRGAAPNLFVEELADAIALLGMEAGVGVRFSRGTTPSFGDCAASARRVLAASESLTKKPGP